MLGIRGGVQRNTRAAKEHERNARRVAANTRERYAREVGKGIEGLTKLEGEEEGGETGETNATTKESSFTNKGQKSMEMREETCRW